MIVGGSFIIAPAFRGRGPNPFAGMMLLVLSLAAVYGCWAALLARRRVRQERAATRDPAQALRLYYQLGWAQRRSALYLVTPPAAARAGMDVPSKADLRWKRFHRTAQKALDGYMARGYDMEAVHQAGITWDATLVVQAKLAEVSASGTKARAVYRITFPALGEAARALAGYQRFDEPQPLYELEGTASLVQTPNGTWLLAEGPIDPMQLIDGPDDADDDEPLFD